MLHAWHDATSDRRSRLLGIGAAIAVHLLIVAFILSGLPKYRPAFHGARELILALMPAPKPVEVQKTRDLPSRRSAPTVRSPDSRPVTILQTAPSRGEELRVPFLRCAPEHLGDLPPEERVKCGGFGFTPPDDKTLLAFRSHVREPGLRAAELAERNAPARADCTYMDSHVVLNMVRENSLLVDPLCAAGKIRHAVGR